MNKKGKEEPDDGADENVKGKDESLSKEGQIDCKVYVYFVFCFLFASLKVGKFLFFYMEI